MSDPTDILFQTIERIRLKNPKNSAQECEDLMRDLISRVPTDVLQSCASEISVCLAGFNPKRRRDLTKALSARLEGVSYEEAVREATAKKTFQRDFEIITGRWIAELEDLSARHLFQWEEHYSPIVRQIFHSAIEMVTDYPAYASRIVTRLRHVLEGHTREIMEKGRDYKLRVTGERAIYQQAIRGVVRFLSMIADEYDTRAQVATSPLLARTLRHVGSAMLCGVLSGLSQVEYPSVTGAALLDDEFDHIVSFVPYLTLEDASALSSEHLLLLRPLETGYLYGTLLSFLDRIIDDTKSRVTVVLLLVVHRKSLRRLECQLAARGTREESHYFTVHLYTDELGMSVDDLQGSLNASADLILGGANAEVESERFRDLRMSEVVVPIETPPSHSMGEELESNPSLMSLVHEASARGSADRFRHWFEREGESETTAKIAWNYANDFPVQEIHRNRQFLVQRSSLRRLLVRVKNRTGVRVWCSVRRSGKTTACRNLLEGEGSGATEVLYQTCGSASDKNEKTFFSRFSDQAASFGRIPPDFVDRFIEESMISSRRAGTSDAKPPPPSQLALILDEYEQLFEEMQLRSDVDRGYRTLCALPLLNQLDSFAKSNLLILCGQNPTAHYILMERNQLSPNVRRDVFPLFPHMPDSTDTEFGQLVRKVVSRRIDFTQGFLNAVHRETAGHPFLTIGVLRMLFDFVLTQSEDRSFDCLTEELFEEFAEQQFQPQALRRVDNEQIAFFRQLFLNVTRRRAMQDVPWEVQVMACIREIVRNSPDTFSCSEREFRDRIVKAVGGGLDTSVKPSEILREGLATNFFASDGPGTIRVAIPLFGRLVASIE